MLQSFPVLVTFTSELFTVLVLRHLYLVVRNQHLIDQATMSMLERMIGFGPGQLGKVAWIAHCMYEDADGKVCSVK